MKSKSLPLRIFWMLIGITAILLSLHLAFQHLNLSYNEKNGQVYEISNRFDMDDEASLPTWFSQAVWMGVAAGGLLAARLSKDKTSRKVWMVMTFIGIFFSIDEVSGIHELSLQSLHLLFFGLEQSSSTLNAWWLVVPPILVFVIWFIRKSYGVLRFKLWMTMMLGLALFLMGAIGIELYGNDIPHHIFYYQGIVTGAEESLEMLGAITILYVTLSHLDGTHGTQIKDAWQNLKHKKISRLHD